MRNTAADGAHVAARAGRYAAKGAGPFCDAGGTGRNWAAPLLLTGTTAYFTGKGAPMHCTGAAFNVAAMFGPRAIAMLRRLPCVTRTAIQPDQIPPATT